MERFSSWWLNHPSEKYARQIGLVFPNFRGENTKCLKPPPIDNPSLLKNAMRNGKKNNEKQLDARGEAKPSS